MSSSSGRSSFPNLVARAADKPKTKCGICPNWRPRTDESSVGYSRAVRVGKLIFVSGMTTSDEDAHGISRRGLRPDAVHHPDDQIDAARSRGQPERRGANATLRHRHRLWEEIREAHGELFSTIHPADTVVEFSRLINLDHLVEIKVDAVTWMSRVHQERRQGGEPRSQMPC